MTQVTTLKASELEEMIGETVGRLFADQVTADVHKQAEAGQWPEALWQQVVEGGLPRAPCSTAQGGIDAGWSDIYPVLRGIGFWNVPLPLSETLVAASLLDRSGVEVPDGPLAIAAMAPSLTLVRQGDTAQLHGSLPGVPWGAQCDWLLASVADAAAPCGISLVLVNVSQPSVRAVAATNMAAEPRDELRFEHTPVAARLDNPVPALGDPIRSLGALARCAMLVGALERALGMTVQYVNERVQFGKPLARQQVILQQLAAAAGAVVAAKVATRVALDAMRPERELRTALFDIAVAKVRCGAAAALVPGLAHQFHGAIGFTHEYALHRSTGRLWSWRHDFGGEAAWAGELGRTAISGGGAGFWAALCERRILVAPA